MSNNRKIKARVFLTHNAENNNFYLLEVVIFYFCWYNMETPTFYNFLMASSFNISQNHRLTFKIEWDIEVYLNQWSLNCALKSLGAPTWYVEGGQGLAGEGLRENHSGPSPTPSQHYQVECHLFSVFIIDCHMFLCFSTWRKHSTTKK